MSMFKKLIAMTLALAMVLSVSAFAGNYKDNTYADAQQISEDCEDAVELLYALDIMKGDEKGNFNPNATITRAEVAKMIYVILNYGKDDKAVNYVGGSLFSDVPAGAWYEGYVNYCAMRNLIQGIGDGKFAPTAPVTVPAVAKMLLTAIGYSAAERSYVGANWANNVLADAAVIGLLEDFNYSTTAAAPRQWVAVLFQNALLSAYTYVNMAPTVSNGLITSIVANNKDFEGTYTTMGNKYYGLEDFTAVAVATENVSFTGEEEGEEWVAQYAENGILFDNDEDLDVDLGYMDLGQEYRVIHNGDTIYSIRNTGVSVVAESLLRDVEAKVVTGTSGNWANNRYEFTIGDMVAKFDKNGVNYATVSFYPYHDDVYSVSGEDSAKDLYDDDYIGKNYPYALRAIDADGDGDIDYTMYLYYRYALVTAVGTSRAYGDYITMESASGYTIEARNGAKWYLDDVVNCDDELEEDNYVKCLYNPDNEKFDLEVLPVVEDEYERLSSGHEFTIGGEEYVWAGDNFGKETVLYRKNLGETVIVAVDGDMIVAAASPKDVKNDLAGINDQLVIVLDKSDHYYQDWDKDYAVKYLDINNEVHTAVWLPDLWEDWMGLNTVKGYNDGENDGDEMLYILSTNDDGEVTDLAPAKYCFEDLNAEECYFFEEKGIANWKVSDKHGRDFVELDNTFFVGMIDDGELVVEAMPLADLGDVKTGKDARYEGIFEMSGNKVNTLAAGYVFVDELTGDTEENYLYVTDVWNDADHSGDTTMAHVIFPDNSEADVELTNARKNVALNELYTYEYNVYKDIYTLKLVKMNQADLTGRYMMKAFIGFPVYDPENEALELVLGKNDELFYGDEIFAKLEEDENAGTLDLSGVTTFALKTIEITRDEDMGGWDPETILEHVELQFVTLDDLKEMTDILVNGNEVAGDTYFTDFHYVEDDIFYVVSYRIVDMVQDDFMGGGEIA